MILRFKYFGMIAEALKQESEELDLNVSTVSDIENRYKSKLENINFKVAVNHNLVESNQTLNENDEVALLPPFAGG